MFGFVFIKFRKLKKPPEKTKNLIFIKLRYFYCLSHSLCCGVKIVYKKIFWLFDDVIKWEFGKGLLKPIMKMNFWYQFFFCYLLKQKILFSYVVFYAVKFWLQFSFNLESNFVYITWLHQSGSRLLKKSKTRCCALFVYLWNLKHQLIKTSVLNQTIRFFHNINVINTLFLQCNCCKINFVCYV